jgi:LPXTG-site transpeptidase (sortase) family protein
MAAPSRSGVWRLRRSLLGLSLGMAGGTVVAAAPVTQASAVAATSRFVAVAPDRLLDTRPSGALGRDGVLTLAVTGRAGVPANAVAVVLNVTATRASAAGFVTAYPAGIATPNVSNLNLGGPGATVANLATVPLGANGSVSFYTAGPTDLIVDIFGYYVPSGAVAAGRFTAVNPNRVYDSRNSGVLAPKATVQVGFGAQVPPSASAVVLNVTMVNSMAGGYLTVWAAGTAQPGTSNVNTVTAGQTVANQVIVPVTAGGVQVFSDPGGHLLVDLVGYFTGASAAVADTGLFVPISPTRFLDTRQADNPLGAHVRPSPGFTVERGVVGRTVVPSAASAIVMNTTLVNAREAGYVTTYAAGTGVLPNVSTLNVAGVGSTVANHTIAPVSTRGVAFYTSGGGHFIADVSGYFTGTAKSAITGVVANPEPTAPILPGRIVIPALDKDEPLLEGIDIGIVDQAPGHWPGTSGPGGLGNMTIFGHRVSHSAPFLNLDLLSLGDSIFIVAEGVTYRYDVIGANIVLPNDLDVLNPQDPNGRTLTLIACHPPGSITYRYVVRARFGAIVDGI